MNPTQSNAFDIEPQLHGRDDSVAEVGYTENRWLNDFALECGYQELLEVGNETLRLFKDGCYHVRWWLFDTTRGNNFHTLDQSWDTFDSIEEARQTFANKAKERVLI